MSGNNILKDHWNWMMKSIDGSLILLQFVSILIANWTINYSWTIFLPLDKMYLNDLMIVFYRLLFFAWWENVLEIYFSNLIFDIKSIGSIN